MEDDSIFHTSADQEPLKFIIGEGQVLPGIECAVIGMSPGESKTTTVLAEHAYGPRHEEMVQVVPGAYPTSASAGTVCWSDTAQDGTPFVVTVIDLSALTVTRDANHPLAGGVSLLMRSNFWK